MEKRNRKPIRPLRLKMLAKKNGWHCYKETEKDLWPDGVKVFLLECADCWIHYIAGAPHVIQEIYDKEKNHIEESAEADGSSPLLCQYDNYNHCSCDSDNRYSVASKINNTVMYAHVKSGLEADMVKDFFNRAGY